MPKERLLEKQISDLNAQIESLQTQKKASLHELESEGALKRLLYETGETLEDAIPDYNHCNRSVFAKVAPM